MHAGRRLLNAAGWLAWSACTPNAARMRMKFPVSSHLDFFGGSRFGQCRFMSSDPGSGVEAAGSVKKVPISLLSGFLGSGKTTLLQEVLQNKKGLKVGVVVNDVANVNIDAKLVRERSSSGIQTSRGDGVEFVELQNGCACCDASGELLVCIEQLLEMAHIGGYEYDRIIIEMSGVAEPRNIRREIFEAMTENHPVFEQAELTTMITVVDSPHFFRLYSSKNDVADHEELLGKEEIKVESMETMADKLDDAYDSMKWVEVERKVVDLLTEQVECADIVVLNKIDRVEDAAQRKALNGMVAALNPSASIFEASFGKIPMHEVFGRSESQYMKRVDSDDEIRAAVFAARAAACTVPQCDDPTHAHSHGGSSQGAADSHGSDCAVPDCTDPSHEHGHGHGHSHGHSHAETAAEKYGITTFVYSRRRPFHPKRLLDLIAMLPVKNASRQSWLDHVPAEKWELTNLFEGKLNDGMDEALLTMHTIVRSKGFVWTSTSWQTALYWSHAGAHFELNPLGQWWAATRLELWPAGGNKDDTEVGHIMREFDLEGGGPWGDRRQEIVFIGVGMDQAKIENLMDACLLTDEEMEFAAEKVAEKFPSDAVRVEMAGGGLRTVGTQGGGVKNV